MKERPIKMIKKTACILLSIILILPLGGCWNYTGLNDMSIVFGLAIDKDPDNGNIKLTIEILDSSASTNSITKTLLFESEGVTLFDAIRNSRKTVSDKLYFGNMMIVVLSEEVARNEELSAFIDVFLRDEEARETIKLVVSMGITASEILKAKGNNDLIISQEIDNIVKKDNETLSSTINMEMYEAYDILYGQGRSLVLPLFNIIKSINDQEIISSNGAAIYKGEKMIGTLSSDETKNLLFVLGDVKGGVITFQAKDDDPNDVSLEISKNKTKISYDYTDGEIEFLVSIETDVFLDEIWESLNSLDKEKINELEKRAEDKLQQDIITTIKKVQNQYGSDIFGFGKTIYKKDTKFWNELKENWPEVFKTLKVEVKCKINILNSASIITS